MYMYLLLWFISGCHDESVFWSWSSCFLCSSITAAPPPRFLLLPLWCRSAPQTWYRLSQPRTPPPTSNGFTRLLSAPWKLLHRHRASTPPPPPLRLHAAGRKWPRTTPSLPAPTCTRGPCGASALTLVSAGGHCPLRSARRVWKDSCRQRRASSLPGPREAEAGCRSGLRGCFVSWSGGRSGWDRVSSLRPHMASWKY